MNLSIPNAQGEKLSGVLHKARSKRLAIICHGHTGNKDRPTPKAICQVLQKLGWNAFRFDFSGNGKSQGRFEDSTFTKCASDLRAVVNYFHKKGYFPIGIIGHSMGGAVCILEAARDKRVGFVVPISAPVHLVESFRDYMATMKTRKRGGKLQFYKEPTKEWLTISKKFFGDLNFLKLLRDVKKIHVPILFIHGTKDEDVPTRESEELFINANASKGLALVHGADHCFTGKGQLNALVKEIRDWVGKLY